MTRVGRSELFLIYALTEAAKALGHFNRAGELAGRVEVVAEVVERLENQTVLDALKLGLQSAAGVSRVFWPSARSKEAKVVANSRAEELRELTGLEADTASHTLGQRAWRDHVEHLDERIDARIQEDGTPFIAVELVQHDEGMAEYMSAVPLGYDAATNTLLFFGEPQAVSELQDALVDIRDRCSKGLSKIRDMHATADVKGA
ncbi:hypothetical protein [Brevundimonas vesicularis]|uniref:hypothetical protein n=1 Tax=Brevundimonas vesicularis TaxID=41276 RepID=UPI000A747982|nr:hypothetical protein [Brevundimonas vesicularis]